MTTDINKLLAAAEAKPELAADERSRFEVWASSEGFSESDISDKCDPGCPAEGKYRNQELENCWYVWQAAKADAAKQIAELKLQVLNSENHLDATNEAIKATAQYLGIHRDLDTAALLFHISEQTKAQVEKYENTLEIERNNSRNIALQLEQAKKVIKEAGDETQAQVERAVRMAVAHCGLAVANRAVSDEIFVRTACDVIDASVTDILRELAEPVLTSVVKEFLTTANSREPFREVWVASDGNGIARHVSNHSKSEPFQRRVEAWMLACFGVEISADKIERNHRFLEESLELVQACGCSASEAHQLVDYVFNRTVGERAQEVGGVMVTLAALCLAQKIEMTQCGEIELSRIWTKVEQIRAKQAAKPKHSPLPVPATQASGEST